MPSTYYLIRENRDRSLTISKWRTGDSYPLQTYVIKLDPKDRLTCSCPSGYHRRYCKHMDIARQWITMGSPQGLEMPDPL